MNNNFIVTRFSPGAAGRFFSCCLQLSPDISSWNTATNGIEKHSKKFQNLMIDYFNECFPFDHQLHLRNEPDIPYSCDFYSGTFPRGENVTLDEYLEHQKKNNVNFFFNEIKKNRKINLILHKSKVPVFLQGSIIVNIMIDNYQSHELIAKLVWLKHYKVIDANTIDNLTENFLTANKKRALTVKKFKKDSSMFKVDNVENFFKKSILNNKNILMFKDKTSLLNSKTNNCCINEFVNFSDVMDSKKCFDSINEILNKNNLARIASKKIFNQLHDNWLQKQKFILKQFKL